MMLSLPTRAAGPSQSLLSRLRATAYVVVAMFATTLTVSHLYAQATQVTNLPILIADFNHDGIPDALVPSDNGPTATLAFGTTPYGSFNNVKGVTFPASCTGQFPNLSIGQLLVGDFNGDGLPDLFFTCGGSATGVMLGNGDGTFAAPIQISGLSTVSGATVGDFDHDGKLDLALIGILPNGQTPGIYFYSGNGDGTFGQAVSSTFGTAASFVPTETINVTTASDINGDGYPDILIGGQLADGTKTLSVFGNNKDGTFGTSSQATKIPSTTTVLGTGASVVTFTLLPANIYGSGLPDLAFSNFGSTPGVIILKNTSTATAFSFAAPVSLTYSGFKSARVGSFTGTAFSDLAIFNGVNITIYANDGSGNYTSNYATLSATSSSGIFSVADANADGYSDIYTATSTSTGALQLAVSQVTGTATATATSQPVSLGIGTRTISATWPGSVDFTGSTATGNQIVNGVPSVAVITSSKNPSLFGDAVTLTGSVASAGTSTLIPTGSLILQDNGTTLTSGTLDSTGKLTYTTSTLAQGTHAITALYAGDSSFAATTSQALSQIVNRAAAVAPILTWATPAAIAYGTPLSADQLNATATSATGATIPGVFAYAPAAGTILNAGLQTLSVLFTPNDTTSFLTATKSVPLTVLQASPVLTLALTSGGAVATTVPAGSVVTLTATVTPATAGQVKFCDATAAACSDIHLLGAAQLASGKATFSFVPGIGQHAYKAVFVGTKNLASGTSPQSALTVTLTGKLASTATIKQSGTMGNYTLTATAAGTGAGLVPTGAISFLDTSNGNASLGGGTLGAGSASLSFMPSGTTATGNNPVFLTSADLNGDGKADLLTTDAFGNTVTVLLGNGDGTFKAAAKPVTGGYPSHLAVADFNGDGKLDLAVTSYYDGTVTVMAGNGDGTFGAGTTYQVGADARQVVAGDLNGDGILDLAVAKDSSIQILLGNGDGTFTLGANVTTTGSPNYGLAIADLNGDGALDLVATNESAGTLSVLLGRGDGTFTAAASPTTSIYPDDVVIGDFNGDGKPDIIAASAYTGSLTVLLGVGDGTFRAATSPSVGNPAGAISVGDFNHDGIADLAVINNTSTTLTILLGNGDGTFSLNQNLTPAAGSNYVAAVDLDGDGLPDLAASSYNSSVVSVLLTKLTQTSSLALPGVSPLGPGTHQVVASYAGDGNYNPSISSPTGLSGSQTVPTLTWTPAVASIVYGTPLGNQQLNAVVTNATGVQVAGTFVYTPAAGTILGVGQQTLKVSFTPTDPIYVSVTGTATITVTPATPVLTWATPANIAYGIPLSSTQLNAAVVGVTGAALPGVFTYTPALGTILAPGTQTLNVRFVPTDATDYTVIAGSVKLLVTGVTLTSVTPSTALLGDPDKTVTLVGSGFVSTSFVQVNGTAVTTTLVSPTTLTAVIPAANFAKVGTLQIVVVDPTVSLSSLPLTVMVAASTPSVTLGGPSTTQPGSQPSLSLSINNPYPVALTAVFSLAFTSSVTPATDDPAIQFANGSRTYTFVIPANSTAVPPILLQSGTVAGTITIPLVLTAGGANVTPTNLQPVVIVIPPAVPSVSTTTITRNGGQLSVAIHGFSNTRELTQATFHFVGIGGAQISTPDITAPVTTLFTGWFASAQSAQNGSTFTYTQVFNVSDNAANIGSVQVTLTNSVGNSQTQTAQ